MSQETVTIETPNGPVSGLWDSPPVPSRVLVLAHGAGAGMRHRFLADLAAAFVVQEVAVLRYQFPYCEAGRNRTDPPEVAAATVRAAVATARTRWPLLTLFAAGKSFGGRMSSTAASMEPLEGVRGLVFFGFPLHPAGRPAITRAEHLDAVTVPMLFLQGTRDELAEIDLIRQVTDRLGARATLHEIAEANHAFLVPKRTGKSGADVIVELARTAVSWMNSR